MASLRPPSTEWNRQTSETVRSSDELFICKTGFSSCPRHSILFGASARFASRAGFAEIYDGMDQGGACAHYQHSRYDADHSSQRTPLSASSPRVSADGHGDL